MKKAVGILVAGLFLMTMFSFIGCKNNDPIVGDWWYGKADEDSVFGNTELIYTFKGDGTYSVNTKASNGSFSVSQNVNGTWKKTGDGYDISMSHESYPGLTMNYTGKLSGNSLVLYYGGNYYGTLYRR